MRGLHVLDLSSGLAGAYCTRILADGGARILKVESPEGDPLRRSYPRGIEPADGVDSALFMHLACSKDAVVADPLDPGHVRAVVDLAQRADVIVWTHGSALVELGALQPAALRTSASQATLVTITPVGLDGPWADKAHTEFTLQGWAGYAAMRGRPSGPPLTVGGRTGDWAAGMFAAIAVLLTRVGDPSGGGQLVDVSIYESIIYTHGMYPVTTPTRTTRAKNFPGIERTKDGLVGFTVGTGQQWLDFCALVGREDWARDRDLMLFTKRFERFEELSPQLAEWLQERTTAEIIDQAVAFRLPVAEIGTGASLPGFDQSVARSWYVTNPRGGFIQPDVPYTLGGSASRRLVEPPPLLGARSIEDPALSTWAPRTTPEPPAQADRDRMPLVGLRVADFTNAWAGPFLTHHLAMYGADVIRIESIQRPDTMRLAVPNMATPSWWETPLFGAVSTNKRSVTLDMNREAGRSLARRLCAACDVVVDNFSPRVMEGWGLHYEALRALRPDVIQVRMPAFGLGGPWRDRVGWAQTMEQTSGMAWVTGFEDDTPETPTGPSDPLGGGHALVALLLALAHRSRTGEGMLVESPLFGAAVSVTAEQVVEHSAYGTLRSREGNRGPGSPQGVYRCRGTLPDGREDRWIALAVESETQWLGLVSVLGSPDWADDPVLSSSSGRRSRHDEIDAHLAEWCSSRTSDEIVSALWSADVPVAKMVVGQELAESPQLEAREWWSSVTHPVTGPSLHAATPARIAGLHGRLHRRPAPLLGEHNREILVELLGISEDEYQGLARDGIIGTTPIGG